MRESRKAAEYWIPASAGMTSDDETTAERAMRVTSVLPVIPAKAGIQ